jgi:glucose-6-phosphate isomerase
MDHKNMPQYRSTLMHTRLQGRLSEREVGVLAQDIASYEERMKHAAEKDRSVPESVLAFPPYDDTRKLADIFRKNGARVCVVIGIGGSSLGTRAIYEALRADVDAELLFVTSVDPERVRLVVGELRMYHAPEEIVCAVVSKSGTTLETTTAMHAIYAPLKERFGDKADACMVAITDSDSQLARYAKKKGWRVLGIPRHIGGRFSVFTPAGLFPLACAGIDTEALLSGARGAVSLWRDGVSSAARMRAIELYTAFQSGIRVLALFIFDARLHAFGIWYQALLAESIGKEGKGLLPVVMTGSDDLHALGQYLYDGSNIIATRVFSAARDGDMIAGETSLGDAHDAIRNAFVDTYTAKGKLCTETHVLGGMSPEAIGELLAEQMITTMILGHLFSVNTFDQPGVEAYKEKARAIIATHSTKDSRTGQP